MALDSGIRNLAYLSGDDTKLGTDHTKADVYKSSNSMLADDSIREDQNDTDIDLDDNFFSLDREEENDSDSDNGGYFSADESLLLLLLGILNCACWEFLTTFTENSLLGIIHCFTWVDGIFNLEFINNKLMFSCNCDFVTWT